MKRVTEAIKSNSALRALLVCCGAISFYMLLKNFRAVQTAVAALLQILGPLIGGGIIAYLLNPMAVFVENTIFHRMKRRRAAHALGVAIAFISAIGVLGLLIALIVPQLVSSVSYLLENVDSYVISLRQTLAEWQAALPFEIPVLNLDQMTDGKLNDIPAMLIDWCIKHMDGIVGASVSAGNGVFHFFLAVTFSIYILLDKHRIRYSFTRWLKSITRPETYRRTVELAKRSNGIFLRFFSGNLLDSLLIGVMCYVFMLIVGLPYQVLVAIIVAVTNFVPTFGPIAGAAIGAFLILLVHPIGALWFLIYTVASQTLDSSVIKPLLFGDTTGLRPLWVMAAIIVGGGLFGIVGMVLGIPVTAILSGIIEERTVARLQRRGYDAEGVWTDPDDEKEPMR